MLYYYNDKFICICQNGPLDKFMQFFLPGLYAVLYSPTAPAAGFSELCRTVSWCLLVATEQRGLPAPWLGSLARRTDDTRWTWTEPSLSSKRGWIRRDPPTVSSAETASVWSYPLSRRKIYAVCEFERIQWHIFNIHSEKSTSVHVCTCTCICAWMTNCW